MIPILYQTPDGEETATSVAHDDLDLWIAELPHGTIIAAGIEQALTWNWEQVHALSWATRRHQGAILFHSQGDHPRLLDALLADDNWHGKGEFDEEVVALARQEITRDEVHGVAEWIAQATGLAVDQVFQAITDTWESECLVVDALSEAAPDWQQEAGAPQLDGHLMPAGWTVDGDHVVRGKDSIAWPILVDAIEQQGDGRVCYEVCWWDEHRWRRGSLPGSAVQEPRGVRTLGDCGLTEANAKLLHAWLTHYIATNKRHLPVLEHRSQLGRVGQGEEFLVSPTELIDAEGIVDLECDRRYIVDNASSDGVHEGLMPIHHTRG